MTRRTGTRRVLLTGFTATQVGRIDGPRLIGQQPGAIAAALRAGGVEVDHRAVTPGEDLSGYDGVVVCVISLLSLTSSYALGALWALAKRPDAVFIVNDRHTVQQVASQFTIAAKRPQHYLVEVMSAAKRPGVALIKKRGAIRSAIIDEVTRLGQSWDHHPVALPLFAWGDPRVLKLPVTAPLRYDPSGYVIPYPITRVPDRERKRGWVLASLFDQSRWVAAQAFGWPVEFIGSKKHGGTRMYERDVVMRYGACWGMLGQGYVGARTRESGAAWWRSRYLYATQGGAVIFADEAELAPIGAHAPARLIERSTVDELREFADRQALCFREHVWTKRKLTNFFKRLTTERS